MHFDESLWIWSAASFIISNMNLPSASSPAREQGTAKHSSAWCEGKMWELNTSRKLSNLCENKGILPDQRNPRRIQCWQGKFHGSCFSPSKYCKNWRTRWSVWSQEHSKHWQFHLETVLKDTFNSSSCQPGFSVVLVFRKKSWVLLSKCNTDNLKGCFLFFQMQSKLSRALPQIKYLHIRSGLPISTHISLCLTLPLQVMLLLSVLLKSAPRRVI